MAEFLQMIALSPTMEEGRIAKWDIEEGQSFSAGDVLCEVETDKASMDYEAPKTSVLLKILVPAGQTAKVGDPIAIMGALGENIEGLLTTQNSAQSSVQNTEVPSEHAGKAASSQPTIETPLQPPAENFAPSGQPLSSPLARKRAQEVGIDLRLVRGSGPGGRVVEKDVLAFAVDRTQETTAAALQGTSAAAPQRANGAPSPRSIIAPETETAQPAPASPITMQPAMKRQVIARRLSASFFSAPHYYLNKTIRAEALLELRALANEGRSEKLSLNAFLIKIAASALAKHPEINVYWREAGSSGNNSSQPIIEQRQSIDIGLAVALPDGLITPVVRNCDRKTVSEINNELASLIEKARAGRLTPEEYEGAGFTISNLGSFGVDSFTAIINPPGSAILAVGAVLKKPVVEGDIVAIGQTLSLTLGCDHRSIDGAVGAAFFADLAAMLEKPGLAII